LTVFKYMYTNVYKYLCTRVYGDVEGVLSRELTFEKFYQILPFLWPPKMREIAFWPSTNMLSLIVIILVLAGSRSTITEITEYTYLSLIKPISELRYTSEQNIVSLALFILLISFLWNRIFTFYYTRVRPQCDFSIRGPRGPSSAEGSTIWRPNLLYKIRVKLTFDFFFHQGNYRHDHSCDEE